MFNFICFFFNFFMFSFFLKKKLVKIISIYSLKIIFYFTLFLKIENIKNSFNSLLFSIGIKKTYIRVVLSFVFLKIFNGCPYLK